MCNAGAEYISYKFKKIFFKVNGKDIITGDRDFLNRELARDYDLVSYRLIHQIQNALGSEKVHLIELSELEASSEAVNQLLRLLVTFDFAEEGLDELELWRWNSGI